MGWVDPWVGSGLDEIFQFLVGWVGLGPVVPLVVGWVNRLMGCIGLGHTK